MAEKSLSSQSTPQITFSDILLETTLNKSISKQMQYNIAQSVVSFSSTALEHEKTLLNATVRISPQTGLFQFTPNPGFRGTVALQLYIKDGMFTNVQNITVKVNNPVLDFRPALAVRAPSCLLCHARVQGDVISDFGHKSSVDTLALDNFFIGGPGYPYDPATGYGSAYNINLPWTTTDPDRFDLHGHFLVPNLDMTTLSPSVPRSFFPSVSHNNLVDHLTNKWPANNSDFKGYKGKSLIYIGAPTSNEIKTNSDLGNQGIKFIKNTATDNDLSGFSRVQLPADGFDYYTNSQSAPMVCEGDLFVDGVVHLENLRIKTTYGCRIYATRSVFINGSIIYEDVSALSNLQVTSAIGVFMGVGACIDCSDHQWGQATAGVKQDSMDGRLNETYFYMHNYRTMDNNALHAAIRLDYSKVTKTLETRPPLPPQGANSVNYYRQYLADRKIRLVDARNTVVGPSIANTSYSRLLVNAPRIDSRYTGNYQGLIIAEFAMWVPGQFSFHFDPVFTGVTLLPFLDFSKILKVEN